MDKIVYLVTDHGVDGRAPETIVYASFDKEERDQYFESLKFGYYYNKAKRIIDIEHEYKQALAKLNGVHKLVLDLDQKELPVKD